MTASAFDTLVRFQSGVGTIDLIGEMNASAERPLNDAYAEAERHDPAVILLNFERVGYINSTGIALIVSLLTRARASNRQLAACGLTEHYREIFQITRLADFMSVYPDENSALREMAR